MACVWNEVLLSEAPAAAESLRAKAYMVILFFKKQTKKWLRVKVIKVIKDQGTCGLNDCFEKNHKGEK